MKRIALAAAVLAAAPLAMAQSPAPKAAPEVPKMDCGTPPELPGATLMRDDMVRKRFEADVDKFKDCIKAYVDERQAASRAHNTAANDAVNTYNTWVKALDEEQKRRRGDGDSGSSGSGSAPKSKGY